MRMNSNGATLRTTITAGIGLLLLMLNPTRAGELDTSGRATQTLDLDQCLETALQNNHRQPASRYAHAVAEAQHQQVLAAYWPQIGLKSAVERRDEDPNYIFPSRAIDLPMGGTIPMTIPGVGTIPLHSIQIPAQEITLSDRDSAYASASATWLLYDGGMRSGYRQQARGGVNVARAEVRRTELQVVDSVKRLYHGAVMARQLHQLGRDTLARMETTLNLTETMFKEGSGEKVKKTDYLENKVMVESLRSAVATLEKHEAISQAALANTMGLSWRDSVQPAATNIAFTPFTANLESMVGSAFQFNPDWAKLRAGLSAAEGAIKAARSGHAPKIALMGDLHQWWNDAETGTATKENKQGWTVGVGVQLPLFDGFLTRNKVREAQARADKLKEEKFLLQEGIGLQIKDLLLALEAARKSCVATAAAMESAVENRSLNTRAYQNELVETEKVIRAQLMEALMSAQHFKSRYEHQVLQSQLSLVVGAEVWKQVGAQP